MLGNISIWQLLILAIIVILIFGTAKLKNLGKDLGSSVKGFKQAMNDAESEQDKENPHDGLPKPDAQFSELDADKAPTPAADKEKP